MAFNISNIISGLTGRNLKLVSIVAGAILVFMWIRRR